MTAMTERLATGVTRDEIAALLHGDHREPHRLLGSHRSPDGTVVRAMHPEATGGEVVAASGATFRLERVQNWLWAAATPGHEPGFRYRLRWRFADGAAWETEDPYSFLPTVGEQDLYFFGEGTHRRLWTVMGARPLRHDGIEGVSFTVWAPTARRVSVVGDFCRWDGRRLPMRQLGTSGVFELFVPGVPAGALYKFEIKTREGLIRVKTDPYARSLELPPGTASRVVQSSYLWNDQEWMARRPHRDIAHEPVSIYEVHLGSWARHPDEGNRSLTYREIAPRLIEHVCGLGFTHIELLPIAEHPFTGSWGYQVTGYYAPTARYGTPDDFRFLVDQCHRAGLGVIVDWVPAHFPKDDYALRRFDGTALYEHEDPRLGEHPDWGTLIFNYGRNEVRNFLLANALYWLEEFHVDGLRVDAVASMLYLDYSRRAGEWVPNRYGGRENLDAVSLLQSTNAAIAQECPGCFTIAEESTAWPGVTKPVSENGLGFAFKWNMGWMHDTLAYFRTDPLYRRWHHDQLTFAMIYEYTERFIMPLSHDEVVHGKGSLINKMPGDPWQRFANLRLMYSYMFTRPGMQLLFMGAEIAPWREWNHDIGLEWGLAQQPLHGSLYHFVEQLGRLYHSLPPLWAADYDPRGFQWLDCCDKDKSVTSYLRWDGDRHVVVVLNLTPAPHDGYRIGAPHRGEYRLLLSSDEARFGGSGIPPQDRVHTDDLPWHGCPHSMLVRLPPLGALILAPA
ncbi:MAG: 1,4-alpha-glucan branching protein GlgB [Gemmatimonadota bacterium]|nr:1,4-alpha-glucan branching protein GlgB [Gemmatimonadota bacterium]